MCGKFCVDIYHANIYKNAKNKYDVAIMILLIYS